MKKFWSVLSAGLLLTSLSLIPSAADTAVPSFTFGITDDSSGKTDGGVVKVSYVMGNGSPKAPDAGLWCLSVTDSTCTPATVLLIRVLVSPCTEKSLPTDVCIKSLKSADSSGAMQNASLLFEANTNKFPKNDTYQTPAGGGISVWRGSSSLGGTLDYSVSVNIGMMYWRDSKSSAITGYSAQIVPVTIKDEAHEQAFINSQDNNWHSPCVFVDPTRCAMAAPFQADQKMELALQMDNRITGWIFARLKDTVVSSKVLSKTTSLLTIQGSSINVPSGLSTIPLTAIAQSPGLQEVDATAQGAWSRMAADAAAGKETPTIGGSLPSNHPQLFSFPVLRWADGTVHYPSKDVAGIGFFQAIEPWLKTSKLTPTWRFQGMAASSFWDMSTDLGNKVYACTVQDKSKIHGVISTNAMAYTWNPPELKDGSLNYKVAGAHTDLDGSIYKGNYTLSMNVDSAKCMYGFKTIPAKATVSVVSADGTTQDIATEALNVSNNWMNLSANNFTFSAPTIKIKLSQSTTSGTASTTKPAATSAQKGSIICVKGTSVMKIAGANSKCPVGYKKK